MKIFICNGAPGVGKTTFENFARDIMGTNNCFILSTVSFVKQIATECGWNGDKSLKNRKFLSDLKDLLTTWEDVPFTHIKKQISCIQMDCEALNIDLDRVVIFIDVREPDEIKRYCDYYNARSVLITRDNYNPQTSNHADAEIFNYNYDIIIKNNGTLDDLELQTYYFLKKEDLVK